MSGLTRRGLAQSARVGVQRVLDVLDVERDLPDGDRAFPSEGARGEVAGEDVDFQYGAAGGPLIRNVSLRVAPGQRVVMGPTGAGKSTLLSLLPSLRENIAFGRPDARMEDIIAAAKAARIHDMIARLPRGYDANVAEQGVSLSKGEKQRLNRPRRSTPRRRLS